VLLTFGGLCVGVVCHLGGRTVRDATAAQVVEYMIPAEVLHGYAVGCTPMCRRCWTQEPLFRPGGPRLVPSARAWRSSAVTNMGTREGLTCWIAGQGGSVGLTGFEPANPCPPGRGLRDLSVNQCSGASLSVCWSQAFRHEAAST
jgi:hypothetical protein